MKNFNWASVTIDQRSKSCLCSLLVTASLICGVYFIGSAYLGNDFKERFKRCEVIGTMQISKPDTLQNSKTDTVQNAKPEPVHNAKPEPVQNSNPEPVQNTKPDTCKNRCNPQGSEALPQGIVSKTSNLEMRPLWSYDLKNNDVKPSKSLLAIGVGIKQKEVVDKIVKKFPSSDFVVMLFHYDGFVNEWNDLAWSYEAIHVSAINQTKWWFAKRFLHPDIVAEYNYIFLWDEDIGVEHFDPKRYLSIVKDEGLEISQPALDPTKSDVHHQITQLNRKTRVHRRMYKFRGNTRCDGSSTAPPCTGWVEMMVPVFSRAAWRCAWYMIQNDLIHAWGLDVQLGYCAQGDRMKNVGVVDSEYIAHLALPTLGGILGNETDTSFAQKEHFVHSEASSEPSESRKVDNRPEVRKQSFIEMQIFRKRWINAVKEDKCWIDPFRKADNETIS